MTTCRGRRTRPTGRPSPTCRRRACPTPSTSPPPPSPSPSAPHPHAPHPSHTLAHKPPSPPRPTPLTSTHPPSPPTALVPAPSRRQDLAAAGPRRMHTRGGAVRLPGGGGGACAGCRSGGGRGGASWHLCDGGLEEESEPLILSPSQFGHEAPTHLLHH